MCARLLAPSSPAGGQSQRSRRRRRWTEQPFTDDEYAFLRHVRFGELPPAVRPDERVALTETDPGRDRPEESEDPIRWNVQG